MHATRPLHLGLTGNIASGKSTVARKLRALGATIIDADQLAREAVAVGTPGLAAVVAQFGAELLKPDGSLNRPALGQLIFNDPEARARLNAIVHPIVGQLRAQAFLEATARGDLVVISDIPLLFEVGLQHDFDGVILVDASVATRRDRLVRLRGMSAADANARIAAQWPSEQKRAEATWVIDNNRARYHLEGRVTDVWHEIQALAERRRSAAAS
jgi:dephospho-CoA kinase